MENVRFYKSFSFRVLLHREDHHTDNSAGIDSHFLARMHSGHARIVTLDGEELRLTAGDVFYLPLGLRYHSYMRYRILLTRLLPMMQLDVMDYLK